VVLRHRKTRLGFLPAVPKSGGERVEGFEKKTDHVISWGEIRSEKKDHGDQEKSKIKKKKATSCLKAPSSVRDKEGGASRTRRKNRFVSSRTQTGRRSGEDNQKVGKRAIIALVARGRESYRKRKTLPARGREKKVRGQRTGGNRRTYDVFTACQGEERFMGGRATTTTGEEREKGNKARIREKKKKSVMAQRESQFRRTKREGWRSRKGVSMLTSEKATTHHLK